MTPLPKHGLYAVADTGWIGVDYILDAVSGAIAGGAVMIQLRDKNASVTTNPEKLDALLTLCRNHQVPFIINDNIELAAVIGADGVHVGQSDGDVSAIRRQLGPEVVIGVSCHADISSAAAAVVQGADYVAFGRLFASQTKPRAPAADLDVLRQARAELSVPIVAIGGITPDNVNEVLAAGADFCAVIAGIFAQADTRSAARRYLDQIEQYRERQGL